jgi:hypothetical protein
MLFNTGCCNTAVGSRTMIARVVSGEGNTAIGYESGWQMAAGRNNTFVGTCAGWCVYNGISNTFVGALGSTFNDTYCDSSYITAIGNEARWAFFGCTTGWAFVSDRRMKQDIVALPVNGESFINSLKPVNYTVLNQKDKQPLGACQGATGFLAQDVRKSLEDHGLGHLENIVTGEETDKSYLAMDVSALVPFLVKAFQELSAKFEELEKKVNS